MKRPADTILALPAFAASPATGRVAGMKGAGDRRRPLSAKGMGLGEMFLTLAGIALVLGVLMMVSNTVRAENADQQTRDILRHLQSAMEQYHAITRDYPPGPTGVAIHYLQRVPESETHIHNMRLRADLEGFITIDDGYGRPLRYIAPADSPLRQGVFVSAGPDGVFGDIQDDNPRMQQAMLDNIYSSDVSAPKP